MPGGGNWPFPIYECGVRVMKTMMPVGTRITVPQLPDTWTSRSRLNEAVSNLPGGHVLLVAAFAGSGKTMFLADWFTNERDIEGGWLTLNACDNEPGRLGRLVARALDVEVEDTV